MCACVCVFGNGEERKCKEKEIQSTIKIISTSVKSCLICKKIFEGEWSKYGF